MPYRILFTGHMIDAPDRERPRFPAHKEAAAAEAIRDILLRLQAAHPSAIGIAACACGGDTLFHEQCRRLGIPSEICLGLPQDEFIRTSVSFAGPSWTERFRALTRALPVHILPGYQKVSDEERWERANDWMLDTALQDGPRQASLLALWDGQDGDGKGGAGHLVGGARAQGMDVQLIDPDRL